MTIYIEYCKKIKEHI